MTTRFTAEYVFKGTSKTKPAADQSAKDIDKVTGSVKKLTAAEKQAASAAKRLADEQRKAATASRGLTKAAQANQSKISAAGGAISGMAFAAGNATGKLGQATQALAGMAGVVAAAGPLVGGIVALGIGVSVLAGKLDEAKQKSKETADALKKTLGATIKDLKAELKATKTAIEDIGKTAEKIEQDSIKRRIQSVKIQKRIMQTMIITQIELDRKAQKSQEKLIENLKKNKTLLGAVSEAAVKLVTGTTTLEKAQKDLAKNTDEYSGFLARINNLTEQETLLTDLLTKTIEEQGKAKANQINQAKVYAKVIETTAKKTNELMEAEAKYFRARSSFSPAAPFIPSTAAIGGGASGGVRAAQTAGGAAGFDISALGGLAGAAGAPEALTAGLAATAGGGGATAAIGAAAASMGPQIAIAIAGAVAAAAAAPFLVTGAIAGKIISDGIISNITGLPDRIFEALTQEDPVGFIAGFLADSFFNLDKISSNLGPVLEEVTKFLPTLLRDSMITAMDVLITTMTAAPEIVNQMLLGFVNMVTVVMERLPELIAAMIPALIQGVILLIPAAISVVLGVGLLIPVAIVLVGALIEALLSAETWAAIGNVFVGMGEMLGNMVGLMWNTMVKAPNRLISDINKETGLDIPTFPTASISSIGRPSFGAGGGTGGAGSTDGGAGAGAQGPVMRRTDIPTFHNGGLIRAGGRSGEVPIMAQTGEAVLNRRATMALGEQGVNALNSGAEMVHRFDGGGDELLDLIAELLNRRQRNGSRLANGGAY